MWFIPQYIGDYELLCTQYCGMLHANMLTKVRVLEQPEYDKWFAELKEKGKIEEHKGLITLRNNGCLACHSLDGSRLVGPSFKNLYGSVKSIVVNNNTMNKTADDAYIENSIYEPDAEIVSGYTKGIMKSYTEIITPENMKEIQNYLKTIGEKK
jgi:cytochrome c oxidase subunit 2